MHFDHVFIFEIVLTAWKEKPKNHIFEHLHIHTSIYQFMVLDWQVIKRGFGGCCRCQYTCTFGVKKNAHELGLCSDSSTMRTYCIAQTLPTAPTVNLQLWSEKKTLPIDIMFLTETESQASVTLKTPMHAECYDEILQRGIPCIPQQSVPYLPIVKSNYFKGSLIEYTR